jgi:cytosine/adenosine deaminase-related metal-dependent hydrolase
VTSGKRADLQPLRADLTGTPSGDPVDQLVYTAQADNIDTVIVRLR